MSYWPPCFRGSALPSSTTAAQKLRARPSHAAAARAAKSPARLACPARHCWSSRWRMSVRETTLRREVSGPAARSAQARAAHRRRQAVCCFCRAPGRPRFWRGTNALSPPWARPAAGQASAGLASPVRACPMCRPVPSCQRRHRFARVYRNLVTRARMNELKMNEDSFLHSSWLPPAGAPRGKGGGQSRPSSVWACSTSSRGTAASSARRGTGTLSGRWRPEAGVVRSSRTRGSF